VYPLSGNGLHPYLKTRIVMMMSPINKTSLEKLGFSRWFKNRIDSGDMKDFEIARILSVNKNSYVIGNGITEMFAEVSGKFIFNADSTGDFPVVGDWIYVQYFDDDTFAIIHEIFPRKTILKRKTSGRNVEFQVLASNIDFALVMQSLDGNFNIRRLERYLVMIRNSAIQPIVLLSKSDLMSPPEIEQRKSMVQDQAMDVPVVDFSNNNENDVERVKQLLAPRKTYCLLGSSGVGKTTLLNKLLHQERFETQTVREKDARGRHTTSRRQLIVLENESMIIDTPGMRELGIFDVEQGMSETFDEITELSRRCRFRDCSHTREEGCAILAALNEGSISKERYQNYMKIRKEAVHYEMSYLEKRQRDKQFGKLVKSIMKHKKDKK